MVYSSPNLKTTLKSGAGSKPHDVQEALKKKQEAMKLQQDMRKKKQEMLEKQIECQKMLISKLEKNKAMKPEERAEIMKTLKELTGKISQLKDELKTSSTTSTPSKLKSKTEAQKELLDAELDFHKRLSSGEDTTELRKKLNQLQVEVSRSDCCCSWVCACWLFQLLSWGRGCVPSPGCPLRHPACRSREGGGSPGPGPGPGPWGQRPGHAEPHGGGSSAQGSHRGRLR